MTLIIDFYIHISFQKLMIEIFTPGEKCHLVRVIRNNIELELLKIENLVFLTRILGHNAQKCTLIIETRHTARNVPDYKLIG